MTERELMGALAGAAFALFIAFVLSAGREGDLGNPWSAFACIVCAIACVFASIILGGDWMP